jgi:hypothetical protein
LDYSEQKRLGIYRKSKQPENIYSLSCLPDEADDSVECSQSSSSRSVTNDEIQLKLGIKNF